MNNELNCINKKDIKLKLIILFVICSIIFITFVIYSVIRPIGCYGGSPTICFGKFNKFVNSYFDGEVGTEGFYFYDPVNKNIHYFYSWDADLNIFNGEFSNNHDSVKKLNKKFLIYNDNETLLNRDIEKIKTDKKINISKVYEKGNNLYYFYNSNYAVVYTNLNRYVLRKIDIYDINDNEYLIELLNEEDIDETLIYNSSTEEIYNANVYDGSIKFDVDLVNKILNKKININATFISDNESNSKIEIKNNIYEYNGKFYELSFYYYDKNYIYYKLENYLYLRSDYNGKNLELLKMEINDYVSSGYYKEIEN